MIKCKKGFAEVNKQYDTDADDSWAGFVFKNPKKKNSTEYIVVFQGKPSGTVIAHECVHLSNQVFIDRLMELDPHNDEPQAYLLGWFYTQIEKYFKK